MIAVLRGRGWAALTALLGLLIVVSTSAATAATTDDIAVAFTPAEMTLVPGEAGTATLTINNPTAEAASLLGLKIVADASVTAMPSVSELPTSVGAGGSVAVPYTVTLASPIPAATTVVATVELQFGSVVRTEVAALKVSSGSWPTAAPSPIAITPASSSDSLVEFQTVDVIYTLQNTSTVARTLNTAVITYPSSLIVTLVSPTPPGGGSSDGKLEVPLPATLAGGDGTDIHLSVTTKGQIQPGDALIVLTLRYSDQSGSNPGYTSSTETLKLSVFGESAILTLLTVPAVFLLPGLIFAVLLWLLWTRVYPRRETTAEKPEGPWGVASTVVLWVPLLLLTLLFPYLYAWVTSIAFGDSRDYRGAYGFVDIVGIWMLATICALVVWSLAIAVRGVARLTRSRLAFAVDDPPLVVLRKLRWRWRRNRLQPLRAMRPNPLPSDAAAQQQVFVLRRAGSDALVTPGIRYAVPSSDSTFSQLVDDGHAHRVYWHARKPENNVALNYAATGSVSQPTSVVYTQLSEFGHTELLIPGD